MKRIIKWLINDLKKSEMNIGRYPVIKKKFMEDD